MNKVQYNLKSFQYYLIILIIQDKSQEVEYLIIFFTYFFPLYIVAEI